MAAPGQVLSLNHILLRFRNILREKVLSSIMHTKQCNYRKKSLLKAQLIVQRSQYGRFVHATYSHCIFQYAF